MDTPRANRRLEPELACDPRWELVQRILASSQFKKASRLRDFLLYVSERALRNQTEGLVEHDIGLAVFDRPQGYSTADDNIVRVHARELRSRLEEYFRSAGTDERLLLEIPKGGYVPVFRERISAVPVSQGATLRRSGPTLFWKILCLALAMLLVLAVVGLGFQKQQLRRATTASSSAKDSAEPWPLAVLFDRDRTTWFVVPDSSFGLVQGLIDRNLTLDDYLHPGYPEAVIPPEKAFRIGAVRGLTSRPYTTFANVVVASHLARLAERHRWRLSMRFSRDLKLRDLDEGNFIFLGSPASNPWVSVFEKEMNFQFYFDRERGLGGFRNSSPQPGEQPVYTAGSGNGLPGEAFAVVSLWYEPSPASSKTQGTKVLIIEGSNMEGTEAAWDFISNPATGSKMKNDLGFLRQSAQRYRIEVLLRTRAMGGAARETRVVTMRSGSKFAQPDGQSSRLRGF